jgi:hypothetical protein
MTNNKEMSFLQHLEALRWHLIRGFVAIAVLSVCAFLLKEFVLAVCEENFACISRRMMKNVLHLEGIVMSGWGAGGTIFSPKTHRFRSLSTPFGAVRGKEVVHGDVTRRTSL